MIEDGESVDSDVILKVNNDNNGYQDSFSDSGSVGESFYANRQITSNFEDENLLEDVIESSYNLEDSICNSDFFNRIFMYRHNLSFEESLIFELKFNQFSNREIATLLDISYKKVDNCLRKIRNKLVKFKITL